MRDRAPTSARSEDRGSRRRRGGFVVSIALSAAIGIVAAPAVLGAASQIPEGVDGPFEPHPEAIEALSRLYSPYCPGFMLEVCPSPNAAALRDSMHMLAYEGRDADEIVDWVLANHGEEWLAQPEGRGRGLVAWVLPPLALVVGAGLVTLALRRSLVRRSGIDSAEAEAGTDGALVTGSAGSLSEDEEARLRSAIREIELSEDPSF